MGGKVVKSCPLVANRYNHVQEDSPKIKMKRINLNNKNNHGTGND